MSNIIAEFNWLDILYLAILCGMIYNGSHTGIGKQLISIFWWVILIFFSLNFYNILAANFFTFVVNYWAKPLAFATIVSAILLAVRLLNVMFNIKNPDKLVPFERAAGAFLAALSALLISGVIGIMFLLLPYKTCHDAVTKNSYSGMRLVDLDITIYSWFTKVLDVVKSTEKQAVMDKLLDTTEKETK